MRMIMYKFFLPFIVLITSSFSLFAMPQSTINKEVEQELIELVTKQNEMLKTMEEQIKELAKKHESLVAEVDRIEATRAHSLKNASSSSY